MPAVLLPIFTDPTLLDLPAIHAFLTRSYWSPGIGLGRVERAIRNSLCFAAYDHAVARADGRPNLPGLVGFARVVTDRATFAYLCDVFVIDSHRGRGISKQLVQAVVDHPDLAGLRRFALFTKDAHTLYTRFGFTPTPDPSRYLERVDREGYLRDADAARAQG